MPRYFFHAFEGENSPEREGSELSDLAVARFGAVRKTVEKLRDKAGLWYGPAAILVILGMIIEIGLLSPS